MTTGTAIYALRATVTLAQGFETDGVLSSSKIIELASLPEHYGETIVNLLRRAGLAHATKGKRGGYRLTRPPEQITMADILRAIDGPIAPVPCVRPEGKRCGECPGEAPCMMRPIFAEAYEALVLKYESVTLADLLALWRAKDNANGA